MKSKQQKEPSRSKKKSEKRENLRFCVRIETIESKMNTAKDSG
jgi:hypothetical protein